ncbi:hypothetical protein [Actinomadura hallensis]|nr:hypothetical protein [Actinomadura hallensis]HLV75176.1 hypothetical protein [Vulgatibacteraceae bacterium]
MTPHAEVSEVWPRDGRIVIRGEIVAASATAKARWRLRLTSRERKRPPARVRALGKMRSLAEALSPAARPRGRFTVPVTLEGTKFEAVLPLEPLVPAKALPREHWDLHLVTSGERPLRLGRHLDDMPGKKRIVTFPRQTVDEPSRVSIRPYYTDGDNLSIRCLSRDGER